MITHEPRQLHLTRCNRALVEVIESLTSEQLLLVARWLDIESEMLERTLANVTVLPDISDTLKICARLAGSQANNQIGNRTDEPSATVREI